MNANIQVQVELPVAAAPFIYAVRHRILEGDCPMEHGPLCAQLPQLLVDKYPVTNAMFAEFLRESGYMPSDPAGFLRHWHEGTYPEGQDNHPVVWVSQADAAAYASFYGKRLPTDVEWQYLAGGSAKTRYPWGDTFDADFCNAYGETSTPVDAYPGGASPFGLFDMCGNCWEMVSDLFDDGMHRFTVLRGGSYYRAPHFWHAEGGVHPVDDHLKMPLLNEALNRNDNVGFRCVRELAPAYEAVVQERGIPREIVIETACLAMTVCLENGIYVSACSYPVVGTARTLTLETGELFRLVRGDATLTTADFTVQSVTTQRDETQTLTTIHAANAENALRIRLTFVTRSDDTITVALHFADDWRNGAPEQFSVSSPFMAHLTYRDAQTDHVRLAGNPSAKPDGSSAALTHWKLPLPTLITNQDDDGGLAVRFPDNSDMAHCVQSRNLYYRGMGDDNERKRHSFPLRGQRESAVVFEFELQWVAGGWRTAVAQTRAETRERLDRSEYRRDDLKWFNDCLLHHFTYLFSKEIYDYDRGVIDIDRLLDSGAAFGGYDTVTLWHQYPRLGVDRRTQWDFFDDFPGGRGGLRAVVDAFHTRGVRILLPYKPWDAAISSSEQSLAEQAAQLVVDTDCDGLFLDTMDNVPRAFRIAIDAVKRGVVLCAENHPSTLQALSLLTAAWDQIWSDRHMPEVTMLRYLLPEHNGPCIARFALDKDKDALIDRAMFSGAGLVLWQDVFGSWLPYTAAQAARIRQYKALWAQYRKILQCAEPTPLVPTLQDGLYANVFPADDGRRAIVSLYAERQIEGELLCHGLGTVRSVNVLCGDVDISGRNQRLQGRITPYETSWVLVEMEVPKTMTTEETK